jgi:hypothetical protein
MDRNTTWWSCRFRWDVQPGVQRTAAVIVEAEAADVRESAPWEEAIVVGCGVDQVERERRGLVPVRAPVTTASFPSSRGSSGQRWVRRA